MAEIAGGWWRLIPIGLPWCCGGPLRIPGPDVVRRSPRCGGGRTRTCPGRRKCGLAPIASRLASYSRGHSLAMSASEANGPSAAAAMLHSESPDRTVTSRRASGVSCCARVACGQGPGIHDRASGFHRGSTAEPAAGSGAGSGAECLPRCRRLSSESPAAAAGPGPGSGTGPGSGRRCAAVASGAVSSCSPTAARASRRMNAGLNLPVAAAARVLPCGPAAPPRPRWRAT